MNDQGLAHHDQRCEAHDNIQRNCYCQQRRERIYIESLESDRDRWKGMAEKMAHSFKKVWDWYESGDTSDSGLGHALAEGRQAYSDFNEAMKK
jgi:hypothetical protein